MKKLFVTGIGTGIGKTMASAILAEAWEADYWKPVQCGNLEHTDSDRVRQLVSNPVSVIHPEAYKFNQPVSPHAAAQKENVCIDLQNIRLPQTDNALIIEGAGGLLVPLNEQKLVIDLIQHLHADVVLVSRNYLGSINHTLLSVEVLAYRKINVLGIIFNGPSTPSTEDFVISYTGLKKLGHIEEEEEWTRQKVRFYADHFSGIL